MWYDRGHENPSIHPTLDRKRTQPDPSKLTLQRRLCLAAIPDPVGVRSCRTGDSYSQALGCHRQTVLNIIHSFNAAGLAVLEEGSSRPHRLRTTFPDETLEALRDLLHRSPRDFGLDISVWTLSLAAQISFQQGLTPRLVSGESVRRALKRLGKSWKRAKHWITSPDPQYLLKKTLAIA